MTKSKIDELESEIDKLKNKYSEAMDNFNNKCDEARLISRKALGTKAWLDDGRRARIAKGNASDESSEIAKLLDRAIEAKRKWLEKV